MKVALSKLSEARRPVRPVLEETVEFLELRDSMDSMGQLVPILASSNGEIIDGHRRFHAARRLNWHEICCKYKDLDSKAILAAQIVLNQLTLDEYRRAIFRLSDEFELDKLQNIAHTLNRHPAWVIEVLGLRDLVKPIRVALDTGNIDVQSAVLLAKMKPGKQRETFGKTLGLAPSDRVECLRKEVRHLYERKLNRRASKYASPYTPTLRQERSIVKEFNEPIEAMSILTANNAQTPRDGWNLALKWVLQIDPGSIETRKSFLGVSE